MNIINIDFMKLSNEQTYTFTTQPEVQSFQLGEDVQELVKESNQLFS